MDSGISGSLFLHLRLAVRLSFSVQRSLPSLPDSKQPSASAPFGSLRCCTCI